MNYREKIKEAIKCPRLGNSSYGKWGALRYEQRVLIKRLLDELDDADNLILMLKKENKELKDRIDKANWWLEEMLKQAKNDETKAIIYGTLELLLKKVE